MLNTTTKERLMELYLIISVLVLTLLNLGLVALVLKRLNGLRRDLRTPVVKKFTEFKRKSMDIPKTPEIFGKIQREDRQGKSGNQQSSSQNRQKNNPQQNRSIPRRPAAKVPDVFSNEVPAPQASAPIPSRPVAVEPLPVAEGRRPLPPRFNASAYTEVPADPLPAVPASPVTNDNGEDIGMEFDRSKMAHGRRNVVAKPVIEDDGPAAEGNA